MIHQKIEDALKVNKILGVVRDGLGRVRGSFLIKFESFSKDSGCTRLGIPQMFKSYSEFSKAVDNLVRVC